MSTAEKHIIKEKILGLIDSIDESKLNLVYSKLQEIKSEEVDLSKYIKPIPKTIDIEQLKKEQNWKPTSEKEIYAIIDEMDIQEDLDTLLEMLD